LGAASSDVRRALACDCDDAMFRFVVTAVALWAASPCPHPAHSSIVVAIAAAVFIHPCFRRSLRPPLHDDSGLVLDRYDPV